MVCAVKGVRKTKPAKDGLVARGPLLALRLLAKGALHWLG